MRPARRARRVLTWLPGRPLADGRGRRATHCSPDLGADDGPLRGRARSASTIRPRDRDVPVGRRSERAAVIAGALPAVDDPTGGRCLGRLLAGARRTAVVPVLPALRHGVIHNDANDHNVLVDEAGQRVTGLLDLGDAGPLGDGQRGRGRRAYAMFHRADPIDGRRTAGRRLRSGVPLTDAELDVLPDLVAGAARRRASRSPPTRAGSTPTIRTCASPRRRPGTLLERLEAVGPDALRAAVHEAVGR